jgi:hypothetical protein
LLRLALLAPPAYLNYLFILSSSYFKHRGCAILGRITMPFVLEPLYSGLTSICIPKKTPLETRLALMPISHCVLARNCSQNFLSTADISCSRILFHNNCCISIHFANGTLGSISYAQHHHPVALLIAEHTFRTDEECCCLGVAETEGGLRQKSHGSESPSTVQKINV